MMNIMIGSLAFLFYTLAGIGQVARLYGLQQPRRAIIFSLATLAIALHALLLYRWIDIGVYQNLSFFNVLSQVAWLIALLVLLLMAFKPMADLGVFAFPFAALTILLGNIFPSTNVIDTAADPKLLVHVLLAFLTMSVFFIATSQAILLGIQDRLLRHHRTGGLIRGLPPLQVMEDLLFQMIGFGFALLSIVLITSLLLFNTILSRDFIQHTILALLAWFVFAILLLGRRIFGWRGQVAIRWTLTGFVLLFLSYLGTWLVVALLN